MRAINALSLANFLSETSKISFDTVVHTMYETGRDLNRVYRETAEGGLAKNYHPENKSRPPAQPVVLTIPPLFSAGNASKKAHSSGVRKMPSGVVSPV